MENDEKGTSGTCPSLSRVVVCWRWKDMMRNVSKIPREPFLIPSSLLKMDEDDNINMVEDDNIVKDTSGTCPFLSRVVCLFVAFGGSLTVAHCSTAM